jgi:hypothetical protein
VILISRKGVEPGAYMPLINLASTAFTIVKFDLPFKI